MVRGTAVLVDQRWDEERVDDMKQASKGVFTLGARRRC